MLKTHLAKQNFETRFKEHANEKKYFDMTEYDINDEIQNYNSKILLAGIHALCTLFAQTRDNPLHFNFSIDD